MTTQLPSKEQIAAVSDLKAGYTIGHSDVAILQSVARALLAAYDQEPVAGDVYTTPTGQVVTVSSTNKRFAFLSDGSRIRIWFLKHKCKKHPAPSIPAAVPEDLLSAMEEVLRISD